MAGWAGFSDEDLLQIKQTVSPGPPRQATHSATKQTVAVRKQRAQQQQREMARQRALDFAQGSNSTPLPSSQRLSSPSPAPTASKEEVKGQGEAGDKMAPGQSSVVDSSHDNVEDDAKKKNVDSKEESESSAGVKEMDEEEGLRVELNRVEQFRLQQKKMEEENKERRRILADAIKQRSKMAKEEAEKLTKVQRELKHLDSLVNADVAIIRDKIEDASLDFLQAQKRYERAEREFVEAKMSLAEKSDLKETLTEHLYTIIQQNEARKAERLAVMMKELGLGSDDYPTPLTVPPLLSFSSINTLHRPPTTPMPRRKVLPGKAASVLNIQRKRVWRRHQGSPQNKAATPRMFHKMMSATERKRTSLTVVLITQRLGEWTRNKGRVWMVKVKGRRRRTVRENNRLKSRASRTEVLNVKTGEQIHFHEYEAFL